MIIKVLIVFGSQISWSAAFRLGFGVLVLKKMKEKAQEAETNSTFHSSQQATKLDVTQRVLFRG